MSDDASRYRQDLPPVRHAANCLCRDCIADRQGEVRRRQEDARREEVSGRGLVFARTIGPVYSRLGATRAPRPGTAQAIANRFMYPKRTPRVVDVERDLASRTRSAS